jgi:hypothetical protein
MAGVLTVAAVLLFACPDVRPACAASTPPRMGQRTAAAPGPESIPPQAAAPSSRTARLGSTSHRPHREAGAPAVRFHFEPEMAGAAVGLASILPPPRRAPQSGTSRAPPSIALAR